MTTKARTMRVLLAVLLFAASSAFAAQRHATPTGAGARTGMDESNAWSFAEAMYAETGDTVNLHAGTYPYIFAPENSGTGSQPIVFRAFESDVVTITGASDGNPDMVYFPGSYVELWNVYLITAENVAWNGNYAVSLGGDHNALHGVRLIKGGDIQTEYMSNNYRTRGVNIYGSYNTIDSCWIRGMVESVVLSGGSARYHKIRWNRIHNSALNGIICGGSNDGTTNWMGVLIEGNNIDSCGEDNMQWQQGTDPYSYEKNKGYIVRGNYLARAYENAIDRKGAAFVVCENNIMHTANSDDEGWTNGTEDWGTGPIIERGNPEALNEYYCLDRGNVMWDGPGGITMSHGGQFINNLMANNRRKLTVSNTADSTEDALKDINLEGSSTTRSVLNNILIGQPNHSYVWLWNMETSPLDIDNQLYYDTTGALRFYYRLSGGTSAKVYGLSAWQSRLNTTYTSFTGRDAHAISSNPLFVNFPFRPYSYNASWGWSLDAGSPAIGAARCWTFASGAGSPSTSLVVENPYVFTDGFGIVQGDSIDIDGDVRRITSINYSTRTLTLSSGASWSDNDSVWFYVNGARVTNLGPYANVTTVVDPGGDPGGAPATPTALTPANGSTRTSPVTFSWSASGGAENYYLCVSADGWESLIINQSTLTDTFYTASLPGGGSYVWNIAAGNTYGWSAFSGDWTFATSTPSAYRDTLTLSWNNVSHKITPDTTTVVEFSNLQRTGIDVAIDNPTSREVYWLGVTWKTDPPPTIPLDGSWCRFYRAGGDTVYGQYIAGGSSGVTPLWVASNYLNRSNPQATGAMTVTRTAVDDDILLGNLGTSRVLEVKGYNGGAYVSMRDTDETETIRMFGSVGTISTTGNVEAGQVVKAADIDLSTHDYTDSNLYIGKLTALNMRDSGWGNTAVGVDALMQNDSGWVNTAVGLEAMKLNLYGYRNTAIGAYALRTATAAHHTTAIGAFALGSCDTSWRNTALGYAALYNLVDGGFNTALGYAAGWSSTRGMYNTLVGYYAAELDSIGSKNSSLGYFSLFQNQADGNTAMGYAAMYGNITGQYNVALGHAAGYENTQGDYNIFLGYNAGNGYQTTSNNQFIAGSYWGPIWNVYFGEGRYDSTPSAYAINGTSGMGTNVAGGDIEIVGGNSTGNAAGGRVVFKTVKAYQGSGASENENSKVRGWFDTQGNFVVDTTTFFVDATKHQVIFGNNTTTSNEKLVVYNAVQHFAGSSTDRQGVIFDRGTSLKPSATQGAIFVQTNGLENGEAMVYRADAYKIQSEDSVDRMTIAANGTVGFGTGRVGVGTLNPAARLSVVQASGSDSVLFDLRSNNDVGFQLGRASYGTLFRHASEAVDFLAVTISGSSKPGMTTTPDFWLYEDGTFKAAKFQLIALNTAPANAGDTGTLGEIRVVDGYIYVCTATNTWKRAAIATW